MQFERLRSNFETVAFTTAVPFTGDTETIDHDALAENLSQLYREGARLFIPCGNTGEYYGLTDEERAAVVETHVEATGPEATIAAGVAGSVHEVRELATTYEEAGADAIMVMHPDHTYTHEKGLQTYYERIGDAIDTGMVIYKRGPGVPRDVLVELCDRDQVVAVKFAMDDVNEFAQTVQDVGGDVTWINGIAERWALSFAIEGATGYTTGIGNFLPRATLALYDAIREEQWERAKTIQRALRPLEDMRDEPGEASTIDGANNIPVVKHGMDLAGYTGGPVRAPLVDLSDRDKDRLEEHYNRVKGTFDAPVQGNQKTD